MVELPNTRAEAKALGVKFYLGDSCAHGHDGVRVSRSGRCRECGRIRSAARKAADPERKRAEDRAYYANNSERVKARALTYYQENSEKIRADVRRYQKKNSEKINALARARNAKDRSAQRRRYEAFLERHRERYLAQMASRAAARRLRSENTRLGYMHADEIRKIYEQARRVTRETGIPHEVDHVIPLFGKTVSGLHVPWNLQVLPKLENRKKSNRVEFEEAA